ncbi:MAG: endonuclease/exonuclease/phosphatase family protein [Anaerolineae bacterium]|nr:endonuclease/exonuclease/phosphatase family protein [Anaerolineae bacterium]
MGYAVALGAYLGLRSVWPEWPPVLALLGYLGPFLFLPLVVLAPLAALSRSRVALAGVLAILGLFAVQYGELLVPPLGPGPQAAGSPFVLMTYNLGPGRALPAQVVADISEAGADIVAVQELTPAGSQALREDLAAVYPYMALDARAADCGLLSRFPILSVERFRPNGTGRTALHAAVDVRGVAMQVIVLHPEPPGLRLAGPWPLPTGAYSHHIDLELADVARLAGELTGPVLVVGDLNAGDLSRGYASMVSVLRDAFREAGWGFGLTFPCGLVVGGVRVPGPLVRIDYVFHSAHLHALEARVGCGSSDHCFVLARLVPIARPAH